MEVEIRGRETKRGKNQPLLGSPRAVRLELPFVAFESGYASLLTSARCSCNVNLLSCISQARFLPFLHSHRLALLSSSRVQLNQFVEFSSAPFALCYRLDGRGVESRWGRDFPHLSRSTVGSTQPPIQWELGLFPGVKRPGLGVGNPLYLAPRLKKE
jgi:hypothetical protein